MHALMHRNQRLHTKKVPCLQRPALLAYHGLTTTLLEAIASCSDGPVCACNLGVSSLGTGPASAKCVLPGMRHRQVSSCVGAQGPRNTEKTPAAAAPLGPEESKVLAGRRGAAGDQTLLKSRQDACMGAVLV